MGVGHLVQGLGVFALGPSDGEFALFLTGQERRIHRRFYKTCPNSHERRHGLSSCVMHFLREFTEFGLATPCRNDEIQVGSERIFFAT